MGTISLALCGRHGAMQLTFDVDTGNLTVSVPDVLLPALATQPVPTIVAAAGAKLVEEIYTCDLRRMRCTWQPAPELQRPLRLPLVDSGYSRFKLRSADVQVDVTRNAMVSLGGAHDQPPSAVDCSLFAEWSKAAAACKQLLQGVAPASKRHEWVLMLLMPSLAAERRFHFTQVDIPQVRHTQLDVHGLLGQRAIEPIFNEPIDPVETAAMAGRDELFASPKPSGGIGGPHRAIGEDAEPKPDDEQPRPSAGRAEQSHMAAEFGPQGEGAIVGRWDEYAVDSLSQHARFRYSRFACEASATAAATAAASAPS